MAAARAGRIKFIGGCCRKCGGKLRYTSSRHCVACTRAKSAADYAEARELLAAAKAAQ